MQEEHLAGFEKIYGAQGAWAELFRKEKDYLGTELLRDSAHPQRYITIDRWTSPEAYESFLWQWKSEYARLDARCEGLTAQETLLGKWESILPETR